MKKIYSCLSIFLITIAFSTANAQVLVVEDFENGAATTDFPGWTSPTLPGFNPNTDNPCEGAQSLRVNIHSGNIGDDLIFLSTIATGSDIDVSFEIKIVDFSGTLTSGNFGTIELYYTVDGGATWVLHDTIDQTDLPLDCAVFSTTVPAASVPAGSDFGWKFEAIWNTGDYYIYIDDFKAVEQVSCIEPVNVEIDETSITFDSATVTWEDLNVTPAGEYYVAFCSSPGDPGDGQFPVGTGNPTCLLATWDQVIQAAPPFSFTKTGLTDGTQYYVYVKAVCGPGDESVWSLADVFRTIAIGSDCAMPIDVTEPLPYVHTSQTDIYGDGEYSGIAGANCGGGSVSLLDGYEVVYEYTPTLDDILTIDVTGLTGQNVGVFVYEDCNDIGNFCIAGATTSTGTDLNLNSLFVLGGESYYIVIASADATGTAVNTDYTLTINGFDCATWVPPTLPPSGTPISFVAGQALDDFQGTDQGVNVTIDGATYNWYFDNAGTQGALITAPINTILINDLDCFWVTQNVGTCESPAIQVCFDEFICSTDLGGITGTTGDSVCDSGTMTLTATANTPNIYWYDAPTGGNLINTGGTYNTDNLTTTTTYYVSEVFLGEGELLNQGNLGPISQAVSSDDDYGLEINATQEFTIVDVQVYVAGSGDITLKLEGPGGSVQTGIFAVTGGTPSSPVLNTITLNWDVDPGISKLTKTSGPAMMYAPSSDVNFPYALGAAGQITQGVTDFGTTNDYYYFFNWTITGPEVLCETLPRTPVDATVYTTKPTTVTADDMIVCIGGTTMLHVTSIDPDYVYTWTWTDASGTPQTATGPDIPVTVNQNNTFTVTAVNPNTTCQYVNTISLEVKGAADLALTPDQELCIGETVKITAGGKVYNFESANPGWTKLNNSTVVAANASPASADWQLVSSPHQASGGIASNDNSQFYISMANLLGPGGTLDTELISPPISMVGVGSASVSFDHYIRYNSNQPTTSSVDVSVNNGPWENLESYSSMVGGTDQDPFVAFQPETIDLSNYVGSTIRIRFHFTGGWGWYWAIDNVVFTRGFLSGSVSWTPMTDLYFDDQATIPYTGVPTNVVYYNASQAGTHTYTATLDILNCTSATEDIIITVYETAPPTGPATQTFLAGDILGDLNITGTNISYYVMDANGNLDQISINTPMVDGTTYYVTQTLNGCESEAMTITVDQECPAPSNVVATPASDGDTFEVIVTWDAPASVAGVLEYRLLITDITGGGSTVEYDQMVPLTQGGFEIVDDLPCEHDFEVTVFSVCDPNVPVYGAAGTVFFSTTSCLGIGEVEFNGLTYYPNPTRGMVYFENSLPIDQITVYSLAGKRIFQKTASSLKVPMDFSGLAAGTYMVAVKVNGAIKVVQIIRE